MKITQIMLAKNFGGAERHFVDLCNELAERGHSVQAIYNNKFIAANLLVASENLNQAPISVLGNHDLFAARKIKKIIRHFSPDIVHTHLARATLYAGRICTSLFVPLVVKTHNYVNLKYYRGVNKFISTTRDQKQYLIDNGVNENKVVIIPNFSCNKSVVKKTHKKDPARFVIVAYGRMVEKKGFEILLEAIRRTLDRGFKLELKLGGDGPLKDKLMHLCNRLQLQNYTKFPGWINNVSEFLDQADLFVLPSLDEPFGIAVLEAMSHGVPVVSTRTRGPMEILDEQTAWLADIGNVDDLTDKICSAIENNQASQLHAEKALGLFRDKYSADSVVPRILDLYRDMSTAV